MSNHSQQVTINGRTIDNSHSQYGRTGLFPTDDEVQNIINNWSSEQLNAYKNQYGLSDDDMALIKPLLMNGTSDADILSYINELTASHQSEDKNSIASQLKAQRSAGYNPDLSGSLPSGSSSSIPSSPFSIDDLPSNGGSGSLSQKFTDVAGLVLKTMSFGLQAYGLVSNNLMSTASLLSGFADADSLNAIADENGIVQDVDGAINDLIKARGLSGRKAKQYAGYLASRINSTLSVTGRLRQSSDKAVALYDSKVNSFKTSDEYTSSVMRFLSATQENQALMAEYDLKIQQQKTEYLANHPNMTAEELDLALKGKRATASKLVSDARKASADADISVEKAVQEKSNTEVVKNDNSLKNLKNNIQKTEMEGLHKMIEFCKEFEDANKDLPRINWMFLPKYEQYKNYKRQLNDYYYHGKSGSNGKFSVGVPGFGNVGFNF